jgi:hypothetical protein
MPSLANTIDTFFVRVQRTNAREALHRAAVFCFPA